MPDEQQLEVFEADRERLDFLVSCKQIHSIERTDPNSDTWLVWIGDKPFSGGLREVVDRIAFYLSTRPRKDGS